MKEGMGHGAEGMAYRAEGEWHTELGSGNELNAEIGRWNETLIAKASLVVD